MESNINLVITYLFFGVLINALYDLIISRMGEEHEGLRLNMAERIMFGILWPFGAAMFIINFIKMLKDKNND